MRSGSAWALPAAAALVLAGWAPSSIASATPRSGAQVSLVLRGNHIGASQITITRTTTVQPFFPPLTGGGDFLGVEITRAGDMAFVYYDVLLASGAQVSGELHPTSVSGGFGPPPTPGLRTRAGTPVHLTAGRYIFTLLTATPASIGFTGIPSSSRPQAMEARNNSETVVTSAGMTALTSANAPYQHLPITIPRDVHGVVSVTEDSWSGTETVNYDSTCLDKASAPVPCNLDPIGIAFALNPVADPGTHRRISSDTYSGHIPPGPYEVRYYSAVSGTMQRRSLLAFAFA